MDKNGENRSKKNKIFKRILPNSFEWPQRIQANISQRNTPSPSSSCLRCYPRLSASDDITVSFLRPYRLPELSSGRHTLFFLFVGLFWQRRSLWMLPLDVVFVCCFLWSKSQHRCFLLMLFFDFRLKESSGGVLALFCCWVLRPLFGMVFVSSGFCLLDLWKTPSWLSILLDAWILTHLQGVVFQLVCFRAPGSAKGQFANLFSGPLSRSSPFKPAFA